MSNDDLLDIIVAKIISGGRETTAQGVREVLVEFVDSYQNLDGKDQVGGYLGIDGAGLVDVTKIADAAPVGNVLSDNGTWIAPLIITSGTSINIGDGVTTEFIVPHLLGAVPVSVIVTPKAQGAADLHWIKSRDATNFTLKYAVAPIGAANVDFDWMVK